MVKFSAPDYVVLVVGDLDRSIAFYRDTLGLDLGHRTGPYAQFDTGRTRLSLYERDAMRQTLELERIWPPDPDAPGFELGFKVDDVDRAYVELTGEGVPGVVEPTDRDWGQRTAYVRDPDGHLIELAQDLGREGRS